VVDSATEEPTAVIQGFHPDVGWRQLAEAAYAIRAGAVYIATNRDLTIPNDRGIAPGNGSLIRAVVTASGVEPTSAGKPEPEVFRLAAERVGARTPLVVGDRLDTDIRGANAAGYASLFVLTGVNTALDVISAKPDERPSFVGESVASLGKTHPTPRHDGEWWHVGEAKARVVKGELNLEGGGIDRVRAACAAVWAATDIGDVPHVESAARLGIE
jgi:ribonucleotide monophosphatase NagD (HAD superfamily)